MEWGGRIGLCEGGGAKVVVGGFRVRRIGVSDEGVGDGRGRGSGEIE